MNKYNNFNDGIDKKETCFIYKNHNEQPFEYMKHAIEIAKLSTSNDKEDQKLFGEKIPQPKIGAILVTDDFVYCACRSALKNGDHAEYTVIETLAKDVDLKNAVLFTTLEPCTPESRNKTESCSEIIINRRIKKVYIGTLDDNPLVFGRGVKYLQNKNVDVSFFDISFRRELVELNEDFFSFCNKYPDIKVLKQIDYFFNEFLDKYAIHTFLSGKEQQEYREASKEELIFFYRSMLNNRQIIMGEFPGQLQCAKEFALCFLKKPSSFFPGKSIGLINKMHGDAKRKIIDTSYIELLNGNSKNSIYEVIRETTGNSIRIKNSNSFTLLREIIANALAHSDYEKQCGITITIDNDYLIVSNHSCKTINTNNIKEYHFSNPNNPILMDFLFQSNLVESTSFGFQQIEEAIEKGIDLSIETKNDILSVKIPLKII